MLGLSGTGKTTTTFRDQLGSLPVQDDFNALFSGGKVYASENGLVFESGGLALHSGLQDLPAMSMVRRRLPAHARSVRRAATGKIDDNARSATSSGPGVPVQDDFNALFSGGKVYASENGCFAKTFGLDPDDEPTIYGGTTRPDGWLENTWVSPEGKVDFFNDSYTKNGRSTFPLATSRDTHAVTSTPSLSHSTPDPAKHSAGRHLPRPSTSSYTPTNKAVLQRPPEPSENTWVSPEGKVDFFNDSYTKNGRSTFPLANIRHRDPSDLPPANYILLLNRNETIIPAIVKLKREQAAAYFMLGETIGTSAGGKAEAGKSLRVPGTNPFFFDNDALMGNRFLELLETMPDVEVYLMNTGRVGGHERDERSKKVKIRHSSAVISGFVTGAIEWEEDPDFGYLVAGQLEGFDDRDLLRPREMFESQGRGAEYADLVARLKAERTEYIAGFPGLDHSIVNAL